MAGMRCQHRDEGPGSPRRLEGDLVQGGRLPQVAIAVVSGYKQARPFRRGVQSHVLRPQPEPPTDRGPRPRPLRQAPEERKQSAGPRTFPGSC